MWRPVDLEMLHSSASQLVLGDRQSGRSMSLLIFMKSTFFLRRSLEAPGGDEVLADGVEMVHN